MDLSLLADPAILSELIFQGLVRGAMYALMGIGLSLIFGILGVVNFAHGEFFMLGTYAMYFVSAALGLPFLAGVAAAAIVPVRYRRAGRACCSNRCAGGRARLAARSVRAHHRPHGDPAEPGAARLRQPPARRHHAGRRQLRPGDVTITYERLAIRAGWWHRRPARRLHPVHRHRQGDPGDRAASRSRADVGIDIDRIYTVAFGIGAALAGAAGALISIFPAFPTVGYQPVLKSFAVVILGGLGSIPGAIAGGFVLGIVEARSSSCPPAGRACSRR